MPKKDDDDLGWLKATKGLGTVIGLLIMAILWCVEFVINPNHNYDYYLESARTYEVVGVNCSGDESIYQLQIETIEKVGKRYTAHAFYWLKGDDKSQAIDLTDKAELKLPNGCGGEVAVALVWEVTDKVHLRIHPGYKILDLSQ